MHSIDENDLDPSAQRVDPHPQGPLVESSKGTNQGSNDLFLRLRRPSIAVWAKNEDSNDAPIVEDGWASAFSQTDCKSKSCPGIRSLTCLPLHDVILTIWAQTHICANTVICAKQWDHQKQDLPWTRELPLRGLRGFRELATTPAGIHSGESGKSALGCLIGRAVGGDVATTGLLARDLNESGSVKPK